VQLQKVAMASELKAVLDSWVRYEQQLKESEQADLVKSVMNKVNAGLKDEKTQREIINAALAEVECEDPSYFFLPLDPVLIPPLPQYWSRTRPFRCNSISKIFPGEQTVNLSLSA
jgi:Mitochondrial ATP synthase B chain precursor (ATP-synt_B)